MATNPVINTIIQDAEEPNPITPEVFMAHRWWTVFVWQDEYTASNTERRYDAFRNVDAATDYIDDLQRSVNAGLLRDDDPLPGGKYSVTVLEAVKGNPNPKFVSLKVLHGVAPSDVHSFQQNLLANNGQDIGRYVLGWKNWKPTVAEKAAAPKQVVRKPVNRGGKKVAEVATAQAEKPKATSRKAVVAKKAAENTSAETGPVVRRRKPVAAEVTTPVADIAIQAGRRKKLAAIRQAAS